MPGRRVIKNKLKIFASKFWKHLSNRPDEDLIIEDFNSPLLTHPYRQISDFQEVIIPKMINRVVVKLRLYVSRSKPVCCEACQKEIPKKELRHSRTYRKITDDYIFYNFYRCPHCEFSYQEPEQILASYQSSPVLGQEVEILAKEIDINTPFYENLQDVELISCEKQPLRNLD